MKKVIISMFVALMASVAVQAQQIAVVSGNSTSTYKTLAAAIEAAPEGSVIYLPGGSFPLSDDVKITKKLTIIGIGYNSEADNADGRTQIGGNLWFNAGSSDSAVMGCYINGNVNIGDGDEKPEVDNILIKYCNLNGIYVRNSSCRGTVANQNLIRSGSHLSDAPVTLTNNIMRGLSYTKGATITNNVIVDGCNGPVYSTSYVFLDCLDCVDISYNIILSSVIINNDKNNQKTWNLFRNANWGDHCINLELDSWDGVFENNSGVNPVSRYHFTEAFQQYEGIYGIYGGTGFSDGQLPPVPYISSKSVPTETDASGNLHVNITVNAK